MNTEQTLSDGGQHRPLVPKGAAAARQPGSDGLHPGFGHPALHLHFGPLVRGLLQRGHQQVEVRRTQTFLTHFCLLPRFKLPVGARAPHIRWGGGGGGGMCGHSRVYISIFWINVDVLLYNLLSLGVFGVYWIT